MYRQNPTTVASRHFPFCTFELTPFSRFQCCSACPDRMPLQCVFLFIASCLCLIVYTCVLFISCIKRLWSLYAFQWEHVAKLFSFLPGDTSSPQWTAAETNQRRGFTLWPVCLELTQQPVSSYTDLHRGVFMWFYEPQEPNWDTWIKYSMWGFQQIITVTLMKNIWKVKPWHWSESQ